MRAISKDLDVTTKSEDRIPSGFDPHVFKTTLNDVSALNEAFLERLVACARNPSRECPLDPSLRSRFANLTVDRQIAIAQCGVLLASMEFRNLEFWLSVQQSRFTPELIPHPVDWPGLECIVSYAVAALFGSLYVLRAAPNLALLILGMSPVVAQIYVQLSERTLLSTAQSFPQMVGLRWSDRPDTWAGILDFSDEVPSGEDFKLNSHCYKLSAAELPQLQPYLASGGEEKSI